MSSTSQSPGGGETLAIFLVLIVLFALRRVYRSYRGIRFSYASTIFVAIFYVAIGSVFSIGSFFEGVPAFFALPYVLVIVASAIWSYRFTDKRISFWRGGDGGVYFKGGIVLYLIYIVALVVRIAIDLVVIGPSFMDFSPAVTLTSQALDATIATDLLLMFGLGLLIGRNARVLRRYRNIEHGKEELPDTPPELGPLFGRRKDRSVQP